MHFKNTKNQVARTTIPDGVKPGKLYLFKAASKLKATYQIRLLLFGAISEGRVLIISVVKDCKIEKDLKLLVASNKKHVKIERI